MVKGPKAKEILVLLRSVVSGHTYVWKRPRVAEKIEMWKYDPLIQMQCLYKEEKKIQSVKPWQSRWAR